MAKKATNTHGELIVDRVLLIGVLLGAAAYVMRGSWSSAFFESGAIVLGVIWSWRVINTAPSKVFRLMATLILVLLLSLLTFYIAGAKGLL